MTTLGELLVTVWRQMLLEGRESVELPSGAYPVRRSRNLGLKTVSFEYGSHKIEGIGQNPQTASNWAKRAGQRERIMQFAAQGRYIGNVAEGKLTRYPN
jgi:hypothetical protein